MRIHLPLFIGCILLLACEDVINPELPTSEPLLVIDALLGYHENNGDPITIGEVRLTLTAPFLVDGTPPATNAQVSIRDNFTGLLYPLTETEQGVFGTGIPQLQFGREYTLEVIYNDQVYTATEELVKTTTIDNLEQGDGFLFNEEEETEVKVTITDFPGEQNQYLLAFGFGNFLVIEDTFFDGEQLTFSYFYDNINPGRLLTITIFGADPQFANYAQQVLQQSGEDNGSGGPFTVPATARGNLANVTNPENFALGYFALSEFDTQLLTIQ
ncbi:DUF4249 family protein [Flagellimonas sp.]|uniref:DUF4249 family protein n=1 Tax=Flagellimonas sp. TaxID=2058762 RepID=UPI003B51DFA9